jgi:hypothetical protein
MGRGHQLRGAADRPERKEKKATKGQKKIGSRPMIGDVPVELCVFFFSRPKKLCGRGSSLDQVIDRDPPTKTKSFISLFDKVQLHARSSPRSDSPICTEALDSGDTLQGGNTAAAIRRQPKILRQSEDKPGPWTLHAGVDKIQCCTCRSLQSPPRLR